MKTIEIFPVGTHMIILLVTLPLVVIIIELRVHDNVILSIFLTLDGRLSIRDRGSSPSISLDISYLPKIS